MAPTIVQDYQQQLIQTILDLSQQQNWWSSPLNLGGGGGEDGGSGVPIGDIFGQLIQSKVAFDTTEAAVLDIPISGASLVTNLNRIRYRLASIEASGDVYKGVGIWDNNLFTASGITDLNFVNLDVTVSGDTATISGGIELLWDDGHVASGVTILNFEGPGVIDVNDDDHHKVTVTISGGGASEEHEHDDVYVEIIGDEMIGGLIITGPSGVVPSASGIEMYWKTGTGFVSSHFAQNVLPLALEGTPITILAEEVYQYYPDGDYTRTVKDTNKKAVRYNRVNQPGVDPYALDFEAQGTTLVYDIFVDSDDTILPNHTPTTDVVGAGWVDVIAGISIQSNKASDNAVTNVQTVIDAGNADGTVFANLVIRGGGTSQQGLTFRYEDSDNYFWAGVDRLWQRPVMYKVEGGTPTEIGGLSTFSESYSEDQDLTVKITCSDDVLTLYVDDVLKINLTDSFNQTSTSYGLWSEHLLICTWDNFKVSINDDGNEITVPDSSELQVFGSDGTDFSFDTWAKIESVHATDSSTLIEKPGGLIVQDTLTDTAETNLSAHTPDIDVEGGGWQIGGWGLQFYITADGLQADSDWANHSRAMIDTGQTDYTIRCDITPMAGNYTGLQFAVEGTGSGEFTGYYFVYRSGDNTIRLGAGYPNQNNIQAIVEALDETGATTYEFKVVKEGTSLKCYIDGVLKVSGTDSTYNGQYVGMCAWSGNGTFWDNFEVEAHRNWHISVTDDLKLEFAHQGDGSPNGGDNQSTGTITLDTWTHLYVGYDNSEDDLYFAIGGDVETPQTLSGIADTTGLYTGAVVIGRDTVNPPTNEHYDGVLDEIRLSDNLRWTDDFSPSTSRHASDASTVLLFHADEGAGNDVADSSSYSNDATMSAGKKPAWVTGHVTDPGETIEKKVWSSESGIESGEEGIQKFGDDTGTSRFRGTELEFDVDQVNLATMALPSGIALRALVAVSGRVTTLWDDLTFDPLGETVSEKVLSLAEQAEPGTPASGYFRIYPKANNRLYGKNDQGTEYDLTISGVNDGDIDHGSIGGLVDDDHSQYALLAGRSSGQTLLGGTVAGDKLVLSTPNTGEVVVNEAGEDVDFRVESLYDTSLLHVVASGTGGGVGIGTATVPKGGVGWAKLAIDGENASEDGPHLQFTTSSNNYPLMQLFMFGHSNMAQTWDAYYEGGWKSSNLTSNYLMYKLGAGWYFSSAYGVSAGSAIGWLSRLDILQTETVFNNASASFDFRVEGANDDYLFFVDADTDRVGIGHSAPDSLLHVSGQYLGQTMLLDPSETITVAEDTLHLEGLASSVSGPHWRATTASDTYPLIQHLNWSHDNIAILFDSYFDGTFWRSSDVGSNFQIYKQGDTFTINEDSGIAAGDSITWREVLYITSNDTIFNRNQVVKHFRVSTPNELYMFHVDSNQDRIGIGTALPQTFLHVSGAMTGNSYFDFEEISEPGTPTNNFFRLYSKANGRLYGKNDAGTEYDLTISGGVGGGEWTDETTYLRTTNDRNVIIGSQTDAADGLFHIKASETGATAGSLADEFILEASGHMGMSFLNTVDALTSLQFVTIAGSQAQIRSDPAGGEFIVQALGGNFLHLIGENMNFETSVGGLFDINSAGDDADFRIQTNTRENFFFLDAGANNIHIDAAGTLTAGTADGTLHIHTASAGAASAHADYDDLVVENSANAGISMLVPAASVGGVTVGIPGTSSHGGWAYNTNLSRFTIFANETSSVIFTENSMTGLESTFNIDGTGTVNITATDDVVINQASEDVDFRVESADSQYMLFVNAFDNEVIIDASNVLTSADGTLHVHTATAGAVAAHASADDLVVENSAAGGISILVPDATPGALYFGSTNSNKDAWIQWLGSTNTMQIGLNETSMWGITPDTLTFFESYTITSSNDLHLAAGVSGEVVVNEGSVDVDFRVESADSQYMLFVNAADNEVIIDASNVLTSADGTLHVHTATAGTIAANVDGDDLVVESSGDTGISILAADTLDAAILFGTPAKGNRAAEIRYDSSLTQLVFLIDGTDTLDITTQGINFNDNATFSSTTDLNLTAGATFEVSINEAGADVDFRIESDSSRYMFVMDAGTNEIMIDASNTTNVADGTLHVHTASAGAVTANTGADDLIVENNSSAGMSILSPNGNFSALILGHTSNPVMGRLYSNQTGDWVELESAGDLKFQVNGAGDQYIFNEDGDDNDLRFLSDDATDILYIDAGADSGAGRIGVGTSTPTSTFHVDQASTTAAVAVVTLDQADVSEEFVEFIGTAASGVLTQSFVNDADVTTSTVAGWVKILVTDDGDQITDGNYYIPFYTLT